MSSTPAGPTRAEPLSEPLGVDLVRRGLSAELGHDPRSLQAALRGRDGLVHGKGRARACLGHEHHLAPGSGEGMEILDLVCLGADGSPHWSRVWPAPPENPRHAGLERWMAACGHQIAGRPASWFDWRDDTNR